MTHHYGIDTPVFVRLLTGEPEAEYQKTVKAFEHRIEVEPKAEFFASNQVIGEAYMAPPYLEKLALAATPWPLRSHFRLSNPAARLQSAGHASPSTQHPAASADGGGNGP